MKKNFFVILTVILMLLPLSVSAKDEWQYSKDTLTFGTTEYKKQEIPYTDGVLPDDFYVYKMKSESELFYAHAKADGYPLAFVSDYTSFVGDEYVYVNKEGEEILKDFISGKFSSYLLFEKNCYNTAKISNEEVNALDSITEKEPFNVSTLGNVPRYEVAGLDETGTLYHIHGAIYRIYNDYYYVNYDELDNSYFDSEGNFSYRKGTVEAVKVPTSIKALLTDGYFEYNSFNYVETFDAYNQTLSNTNLTEIIIFWISSIILGYILPLVPFVLSIVFAQSKKALYPKRWYLLTACSGAWMLIATCILMVILI